MQTKLIAGTPADRLSGLEPLIGRVAGKSILDVGCHKGFVAYALALAGAREVYALDRYEEGVQTTKMLLEDFPISSRVEVANLLEGLPADFPNCFDAVLYLGVHHHLARQCDAVTLEKLVLDLIARSGTYFCCRTTDAFLNAIDRLAVQQGLALKHHSDLTPKLNPVRVYVREGASVA